MRGLIAKSLFHYHFNYEWSRKRATYICKTTEVTKASFLGDNESMSLSKPNLCYRIIAGGKNKRELYV